MIKLIHNGPIQPEAFVTKRRQRVKQYNNDTVYLNDGDEFEIELFNPTSSKVLAKIEINGKSLGAGIVLRPGERVFLERYLDEARKFLFETYMVDKNNGDVMRAIADNGQVTVMFYNEYTSSYGITYSGSPTITTWPPFTQPYFDYTSHSYMTKGMSEQSVTYGSADVNCFYSQTASLGLEKPPSAPKSMMKASLLETGRVEKGSNSGQSFSHDNTSFNSWWSWKSEWKILPLSQKPLVKEDIKTFCTNCGARKRKSSHKFCPNCGAKY